MRRSIVILTALGLLSQLPAPAAARTSDNVAALQRLSDGIAEVAAQVKPGVVAIMVEGTVTVSMRDPFRGTPFERYFGTPKGGRQERKEPRDRQGSGVIVQHDGDTYILTNNHVLKGADNIQIQLTDDRFFDAEVVGTDSLSDIAVLSVDANDLPTVPLGESAGLRAGEMVLAVGNPMGYEHSVTYGIVSATGRDRFTLGEYGSYIQTDAAINPGNSGGALVNLKGELVGINTAIVSRSGGYDGISFAIPVDLVRNVMGQIVEHGGVRRGLLGAYIDDIDPITAEALGMQTTRGVLIESVTEGGAADEAGIQGGDVVLSMGGEPVRDATELRARIGATPPGTEVEFRVLRKRGERTFTVTLGELTEDSIASAGAPDRDEEASELGIAVQELTPAIARRLGVEADAGVLVTQVVHGSEAARRGIQQRDLIKEINQTPIASFADYRDTVSGIEPGEAVLMLIQRDRRDLYVGLRMPED